MQEKKQRLTPKEQAKVSSCLRAKKNKGIKIDDQAIAICISESRKPTKSKNTGQDIHVVPVKRTPLF
jgi:hypothetical protein